MIVLEAPDPATTDAIGAVLAERLAPGDVVLLEGDLGTGKTALARAIIRTRLGAPDLAVPSPTFALVQPYRGIVHADLYRLASEDEIEDLGLFEDDDAVVLIEWPERAPGLTRHRGIRIRLAMGEDGEGRVMTIAPQGGKSLEGWAGALMAWHGKGARS